MKWLRWLRATLRDIGLTYGFSRLVLFVGHGSSSVNNPHKSVYDCGACTGNPGGPNARALAEMLNDLRVRNILARRGLEIPHSSWFLGALQIPPKTMLPSSIWSCCPSRTFRISKMCSAR